MKHGDEKRRLIFLVNRAQAYKWDGQSAKALEIVASQDWSATGAGFRLAAAVLRDRNEEAILVMKEIGSEGDIHKVHYKTWPLFKEIRKTREFTEAFEEVFNEPIGKAAPIEKEALKPDESEPESDTPPPTIVN